MVVEAVGPYRIIEKLGAGGMGEVYLAEDSRLRRKVALKTLPASMSATPEARHRLLREARASAALNHPNIAAVYDVLETESATHIVMEYVQGETLAARAHRERLPSSLVQELAVQICDALAEAHQSGVIHRDLKPANLLLTPKGTVKVLDFGLAKTQFIAPSWEGLSSSETASEERAICGTPPYISPEHLLGKPTDARSDLYSLGVTLYELLAGRRPFDGPTPVSLAISILNDTPASLRSLNPDVDPALEAVVSRAMARNPDHRYPSAAALRSALERVDLGPSAVTASLARRVRGLGPVPSRGAAAVAVLAALVAGAAFLGSDAGKALRAPPHGVPVVVVLPFMNLSADPGNEYLGVGWADFLTTSLARLPGINVVSRSAAVAYRDRKLDTNRIARDLGADFVVDGAIQRSDDQIRVTLSILRAGSHVLSWSRAYDGAFREVLSLQREVADALATEMNLTLSAADRRRVEAPPTTNAEAMADYAQGLSFLDRPDVRGNVDRAIGLFKSAITRDPQFAAAHAGLGRGYWGKYDETKDAAWVTRAESAISEALRLDPDLAAGHFALALLYEGTGRLPQTATELTRAQALQPNSDEIHRALGRVSASLGDTGQALASLSEAIALRPNFWRNHVALGLVRFDRGEFSGAAAAFRRATELQPDNAWAFQMLGTAEQALGRKPFAIEAYRRSISIQPEAEAYANLGVCYYEEHLYSQATAAFQRAVELQPGSPVNHRNLGDTYRRQAREADATQAYRRCEAVGESLLAVNPRDGPIRATVAVCLAKIGLRRESGTQIDRAIESDPENAEVAYLAAVVGAISGDRERSRVEAERAVKLGYSARFIDADEDLASFRGSHPVQPSAIVAVRDR
jgi:tetratricopeptide (TPR) repeat protein/TolB-like protein